MFDALAAAGLTLVEVEFDGESDSGQIGSLHSPRRRRGATAGIVPDAVAGNLQHRQTGFGGNSLHEAIEMLCYDLLSQKQGGWENDGGAFGQFTFDVARRKIELEFNARFTDSTLFNYSF